MERRLSRRDWIRLAAGAATCGVTAAADLPRIPPADEASKDPGLVALLDKIRALTAKRDFRGLEALMLPTFRAEFDGAKGPAAFHQHWHPESPSSPLWAVLERLFSLGGTFYSDTLFAVPYVYARFPAELDPLGHVVTVKADARLLDGPGPDAAQVGTLDYAILPLAERLRPPVVITTGRYLEVKLPEDERRFVMEADVYSPAAHRAFLEKRSGRWWWISIACATLAEPPDLKHPPPAAKPDAKPIAKKT